MPDATDALVQQIAREAEANMARVAASGVASDKFFCEHWADIKKAIEFLGDLGGAWGKLVAKALIAIGDRYYERHCKPQPR